jgi:hypothetical protein
MSFKIRAVGAGLIVFGSLSATEAARETESRQLPPVSPQEAAAEQAVDIPLIWEYKGDGAVIASLAMVGVGAVALLSRSRSNARRSGRRDSGGGGDGGWLFGGDSDCDGDGGDGGD